MQNISWLVALLAVQIVLLGSALIGAEPTTATDAAADSVEHKALIAKATAVLSEAARTLPHDPTRPVYHFRPPAQFMNDPVGCWHHRGWYHLFYQLGPYSDDWNLKGNCWGHARSKDLVHWEHLPIAVHPLYSREESRCNSGSITVNALGQPMIFYTFVPFADGKRPREQWASVPEDDDWICWKRHPANPVIGAAADSGMHGEWGDPFIFRAGERVFLTGKTEKNGLPIYEAQNAELTQWKYQGQLTEHNGECPNFFPLGDKWVLLTSPHSQPRYYVGTFDLNTLKFSVEKEGILDYGHGPRFPHPFCRGFYATTISADTDGRCMLWGWVSSFGLKRGWDGCLGLPRVLSLGADGYLRQSPAPQFEILRGHSFRKERLTIPTDAVEVVEAQSGETLEISAQLVRGDARSFGLRVRGTSDGAEGIKISCSAKEVNVDGTRITLSAPSMPEDVLNVRLFLDHSLLEVFIDDGRYAVTRVIKPRVENQSIALFSNGAATRVNYLEVWRLNAAWKQEVR